MKRHNVREVSLNGEEEQINESFNDYLFRGFSIIESAFYAVVFYIEDHASSGVPALDPAFVLYVSDNTLAWDPRAKQLLDRCTRLPVWGLHPEGTRVRETITHLVGKESTCSAARDLGREDGTVFFHEWVDDPDDVNCPACQN